MGVEIIHKPRSPGSLPLLPQDPWKEVEDALVTSSPSVIVSPEKKKVEKIFETLKYRTPDEIITLKFR